MTLKEFNLLYSIAADPADVDRQIQRLDRPATLCGKDVPENLNGITYGTLIQLQQSIAAPTTELTRLTQCAKILIDADITEESSAEEVFGFSRWLVAQLNGIAAAFAKVQSQPTAEEVQAGIRELNFGHFGTIDWFARRMGITDHGEVEQVPWMRILACMDMDNKTAQYERRLRQVYAQRQR